MCKNSHFSSYIILRINQSINQSIKTHSAICCERIRSTESFTLTTDPFLAIFKQTSHEI